MADGRLRELERRWRSTGSVEDEAAYVNSWVRAGHSLDSYIEAYGWSVEGIKASEHAGYVDSRPEGWLVEAVEHLRPIIQRNREHRHQQNTSEIDMSVEIIAMALEIKGERDSHVWISERTGMGFANMLEGYETGRIKGMLVCGEHEYGLTQFRELGEREARIAEDAPRGTILARTEEFVQVAAELGNFDAAVGFIDVYTGNMRNLGQADVGLENSIEFYGIILREAIIAGDEKMVKSLETHVGDINLTRLSVAEQVARYDVERACGIAEEAGVRPDRMSYEGIHRLYGDSIDNIGYLMGKGQIAKAEEIVRKSPNGHLNFARLAMEFYKNVR